MSTNMARRLARLEAAMALDAERDLSIDAQYPWMAPTATIGRAIESMAMARARRRAIAEGAYSGFGYFPEPADERIRAELVALDERWSETQDLIASLAAWCDEPDQDGWPPLPCDDRPASEPASAWFWERFRQERQRLDTLRSSGQWSRWRDAHPEWSPDMSNQAYLAWDLAPLVSSHDGRPERKDRHHV